MNPKAHFSSGYHTSYSEACWHQRFGWNFRAIPDLLQWLADSYVRRVRIRGTAPNGLGDPTPTD